MLLFSNTRRTGFIRHNRKNSAEQAVKAGLPEVFPRLWRFCLYLTARRELADDLAQSTCLRALEKANTFTPGTHLDRWTFVIARRLWLNDRRAATVRQVDAHVDIADIPLADDRANTETNIFARQVLSQIERLPLAQREAVALVYIEGLSYREAADVMDTPIGTVMSRLASARKRLVEFAEGKE